MVRRTEKVLLDGVSSASRRDLLKAAGPMAAAMLAGCAGGSGGSVSNGNSGSDGGNGNNSVTEAEANISAGGTLNAGMSVGVLTLDGRSVTSLQSMQVMYNIYSKLLDYEVKNDKLKLVGDLATGWEWEDKTTLVFDLNKDAVFQNGEPVTASDVKHTFDTIYNKEAYTANLLFSRKVSVKARDKHTAVFDTGGKPFTSLESNVGFVVGIINKKADKNRDMSQNPVGSGPYQLADWVQGDHVYLKKFENYWKADGEGNQLPYLDEVRFNIYPDDGVKLKELTNGDLNWIDVVPAKDVEQIRNNDSLVTTDSGPGGFMGMFQFNTQKEPFNDANVRKAVLHAINWDAFLQIVYQGTAKRTNNQPLSPATGWNIKELNDPFAKQNIEKAKALLDKSSFNGGDIMFTNYVNRGLERDKKANEVLQAQLKDTLGIDFKLRLVDKSTVFEKTTNLEFGFSMGAFDGMFDPDQVLTVNLQEGAFFNYGNYVNKEIQQLLEKGRTTTDRQKRYETYKQIYEINNEEAGKYYPYWQNITSAQRPAVKKFNYPYDTCWRFEKVWLNE